MNRLDAAFALLVVLATALGGVTVVDRGASFAAERAVPAIQSGVVVETTSATVEGDEVRMRVRIRNPTSYRVTIEEGFVQLYDGTDRLGLGPVDSGTVTLSTGETRTVTVAVELSPDAADRVRRGLAEGSISVRTRFVFTAGRAQDVVYGNSTVGGDEA